MPLDDTNWPTTETEVPDEATALLIRTRARIERGWGRRVRGSRIDRTRLGRAALIQENTPSPIAKDSYKALAEAARSA